MTSLPAPRRSESGRRVRRWLIATVCLVPTAGAVPMAGQDARPRVLERDARAHIVAGQPAPYPAIAAAANVQDLVRLLVDVSEDGSVSAVTVVSGHPMLDHAARTAVRDWRFAPFTVDGRPAAVRTTITLVFARGDRTARVGMVVDMGDDLVRCDRARIGGDPATAEALCRGVLERSASDPVLRIHFEPVAAWMLGRVLVEQGDEARGLDSLTQAVRSATDRQSPLRPTAVAGIIQTLAGAYRAQDDPGSAVDTLRAGLRWFDSQRHVAGRGGADLDAALRAYLPDYADALDADDRPEDAAKVRDRLATLE